MPDASTITAHSRTSDVINPQTNTLKATHIIHDMPSPITKEPADVDVSAPSKLSIPVTPPRQPVTYRNIATQITPPRTGGEFLQIYGYEPKMHDLEHKVGLAAIGRYQRSEDVPYGVIHGVAFEPAHSERKPTYVTSSFQIMSVGARKMALAKAKAKAGLTANKYKSTLAEDGSKVWVQPLDEKIVHSEQQLSIIKLDKDGRALPGQDLTGRCFWNLLKDDIECDNDAKGMQPLIQQPVAAPLPQSLLQTQRNKILHSVASLEPSSQYDLPDPAVKQDSAEEIYIEEEHVYNEDLPYAADSDAFVVFDAEHHVPRDLPPEHSITPAQSRKRKDSSQLSEERVNKRSRLIAPSTGIPLDRKQDTSAPVNEVRPQIPERDSSLHSYTPTAPSKKEHLPHKANTQANPSPTTRESRHQDVGPSSNSSLKDAYRKQHDQSKTRGSQARARSSSPTRSETAGGSSRKWRDRTVIPGRAEETRTSNKKRDQQVRSQSAQLMPTHVDQECRDETDPSQSHTSSSPTSSRSTLASSYGSNKSTPTSEPNDKQPVQCALVTSNSATAPPATTGSPAPSRRVRRDDVKTHTPQKLQDCATPQVSGAVERGASKPHDLAAELKDTKKPNLPKAEEHESQTSKKRSLEVVETDASEVFEDQQRSKRIKKQFKSRKQESEENTDSAEQVHEQGKTVQGEVRTSTPSQAVTDPDVAKKSAPLEEAEVVRKEVRPMKQEEPVIDKQEQTVQNAIESARSEIKTDAVQEKIETEQVKSEMTDVQKMLAARRAKRVAKQEGARYVPPARRTNGSGSAPTVNQNRVVDNRNHRR